MRKSSGKPTVVDLFAGAGGLSSSLEAAGWRSLAAIDNDRSAISSLVANQARGYLSGTRILQADVSELRGSDVLQPGETLDLLSGGPPCQPFSSSGLMQAFADPRGQLFREFVRLADELQPRFVLFENVAGLVTAKMPDGHVGGVLRLIQREFENIGYACRFDLINAADFGAAQRRVRLYMIGAKKGAVPHFPGRTHSRECLFGLKPWVSLREFLAKQSEPDIADVVRPSKQRLEALLALEPGKGLRSGGIVEANRPSGHWGYRQDCFLADLSVPSRTIRAASTPDWIRSGRKQLRRLTWRECLALQGFPSDWEILGTASARFRQIGNAVQGDVGRALGRELLQAAKTPASGVFASAPWPACFDKRVRYTAMEEVVNGAHRRAARGVADGAAAAMV